MIKWWDCIFPFTQHKGRQFSWLPIVCLASASKTLQLFLGRAGMWVVKKRETKLIISIWCSTLPRFMPPSPKRMQSTAQQLKKEEIRYRIIVCILFCCLFLSRYSDAAAATAAAASVVAPYRSCLSSLLQKYHFGRFTHSPLFLECLCAPSLSAPLAAGQNVIIYWRLN